MSANTPRPPIGALIAALALAEVLNATRVTAPGPGSLPPGLAELLSSKCDDPTCDACNPTNAGKQEGTATATEEAAHTHVSAAIEIPPEVAELVGMTKGITRDLIGGEHGTGQPTTASRSREN